MNERLDTSKNATLEYIHWVYNGEGLSPQSLVRAVSRNKWVRGGTHRAEEQFSAFRLPISVLKRDLPIDFGSESLTKVTIEDSENLTLEVHEKWSTYIPEIVNGGGRTRSSAIVIMFRVDDDTKHIYFTIDPTA